MKILTLSNYYPEHLGGIEFVAMNLVEHWRSRYPVRWMACDVPGYPHEPANDDIPLPALNFAESQLGFPYPIPIGKSLVRIFKQVKECDVVHIHDCLYLANLLAFLASRWYRKPLVVTQHVALVPYRQAYKNVLQRAAYRTLGKRVLSRSDYVVFISERVKTWFESNTRFRRHPVLIPNGVDRVLFYPANPEERHASRTQLGFSSSDIVLLFVGRFTQKKGLGVVREIAKARTNLRWIMIGRDELDPRTWGLPNVQVLAPQPQARLRNYYIAADLLVLPSTGEGFPLALQESLSCGLPAAVSKEIAEFVPDAPLIEIDVDSLPALQQTLDNVLARRKQLLDLRKAAAEYAKRWDWANVARQYENLFLQLT
jgi:glycosyltransferase involved in cell wall biosynthesis